MKRQFTTAMGGYPISIETGRLAGQADGAVTVRVGDSLILVTATASKETREGIDFFPLTVNFEEKLYAAGRIPGSFFRREGRPHEDAILTCRLVDRPLRPLFPSDLRNDVQVIITTLSADQKHQLDTPSIIGASAALTISDIPFGGPVGAVRVGYIDGEIIINPTIPQMEGSKLDLKMAGTSKAVTMVEVGADEVSKEVMIEAIKAGHEAMQPIIELQKEMRQEVGKPKFEYQSFGISDEVRRAVSSRLDGRLRKIIMETNEKKERNEALEALQNALIEGLGEEFEEGEIRKAFDGLLREEVRRIILDEGVRLDGRAPDEIRPISCEVGLAPQAHGTGLFTRGETQVLTIATLGMPSEEQRLDDLRPEETKRYIHHYNFPPFSTGETWPLRSPKRREIGHGALAETALRPMIPPEEEFPYTIRLVSEVLSSNGSTSMASVCGSTLALMDTGVHIKAPVAGIAMGLVKEDGRYRILTDIQGLEDHLGDMDFKVAGTRRGITALQMDIKTKGLDYEILTEALERARQARLFILDKMRETIPQVRPELSPHAPRLISIKIDPEKIGAVIGTGGKTIHHIIEESGADIDVEDDGTVYIGSTDAPSAQKAKEMIEELVEEPEIGKIYTGKVVRIMDYGAFVEILPGQDGLVHISQLADHYVSNVRDVVQVGDEVMVMIIDIDREGKIRLSRRAVLEGWTPEEARKHDRKPERRGQRYSPRSPGNRTRRH
ncbi:MAG: polyribonucleotide nucleotidyltransferase [Chloroflexota bacterium]|nr:polyribonucleotide nucleotidyltransferase [Chloroflexota bacterium]